MAAKYVVTGDQYRMVDQRMVEIKQQLNQRDGSSLNPYNVATALQWIIEGCRDSSKLIDFFTNNQWFTIDPTDGLMTLATASDVFVNINLTRNDFNIDKSSKPTDEISVCACKIAEGMTFSQISSLLALDLDNICLTQSQIVSFADKYREWLQSDDYITFFLFKSYDALFVAYVNVTSKGNFEVSIDRFETWYICPANDRHRIVIPKLV